LNICCKKCRYTGGLAEWRYLGPADPSGVTTYRKCPKCGHPQIFDEMTINEEYKGPQPWGLNIYRGVVYKGKKKK